MNKTKTNNRKGINMKGKNKMRIYRHGDILLKQIADIPKNVRQLNIKVLAEGEATGHLHQFEGKVKIYDIDTATSEEITSRFVQILEASNLTHPEHKTLVIEPGNYQVIREQEFDYFSEEIRRVQD
jgi:hypothetical protein